MSVERSSQIRRAFKLVNPVAADRVLCEKWIGMALDAVAMEREGQIGRAAVFSKQARHHLEGYRRAVRRTQVAYRRMPERLKKDLSIVVAIHGGAEIAFDAHVGGCDSVLGRKNKRASALTKKQIDWVKLEAAAWASNILEKFRGQPAPVTQGGDLLKLAAILYGDARANLFHHVRIWKNASDQNVVEKTSPINLS